MWVVQQSRCFGTELRTDVSLSVAPMQAIKIFLTGKIIIIRHLGFSRSVISGRAHLHPSSCDYWAQQSGRASQRSLEQMMSLILKSFYVVVFISSSRTPFQCSNMAATGSKDNNSLCFSVIFGVFLLFLVFFLFYLVFFSVIFCVFPVLFGGYCFSWWFFCFIRCFFSFIWCFSCFIRRPRVRLSVLSCFLVCVLRILEFLVWFRRYSGFV